MTTVSLHPDYDEAQAGLKQVRDCVAGESAVKKEKYTYLPHPSQVSKTDEFQVARYNDYITNAEFPEDTEQTLKSMIGKMRLIDTEVVRPERIAYLEGDCDGDGMPIRAAIEHAAGEVMQTKWTIIVSDYLGLSELDVTQLSIAELESANPRAVIRQYSRESLTNWHFRSVNGRMQLGYMQLNEVGTEFDEETGTHKAAQSLLILALDEGGNYYQQKKRVTTNTDKSVSIEDGERYYVTVSGQPLKFIPVAFACDSAMKSGGLPKDMGFLSPIASLCLKRYNVSAKYKETQSANVPTKWTKGWQDGDLEIFKEVNKRDYQVVGGYGVNNFPQNVEVGVSSAAADMTDFQWYFQDAEKRTMRLGGVVNSDVQMTATEADIVATEQNAMLSAIADSLEAAFEKVIAYCAMFEGVLSQDDVMDYGEDIQVNITRDFATPRLTVDEVRVYIELRDKRAISELEFMRALQNGGWVMSDIEQILDELEDEPPAMDLPQVGVNDQNLTDQTNRN